MVETEKQSPAVAAPAAPKKKGPIVKLPSKLAEAARIEAAEALRLMETSPEGLTENRRVRAFGSSSARTKFPARSATTGWSDSGTPCAIRWSSCCRFWRASLFTRPQEPSDYAGGWIMVAMVILGVALRYIQESRADAAAAKLKAMINVTATRHSRRERRGRSRCGNWCRATWSSFPPAT